MRALLKALEDLTESRARRVLKFTQPFGFGIPQYPPGFSIISESSVLMLLFGPLLNVR
ncbi:hypothetical protein PISMIDRAFT_341797 [Pisolithus microcarpus 441]|uniref:Uncharacterized protein n=1 Tax=Pisolithus microcarpus 441 TaxID=765257 RepID=A0A0C9YKU2_9AGAM|nr:hypothetical protein PISMIDRAFT_341797 [Pisolithus microcarpus 441]